MKTQRKITDQEIYDFWNENKKTDAALLEFAAGEENRADLHIQIRNWFASEFGFDDACEFDNALGMTLDEMACAAIDALPVIKEQHQKKG